MSFPNLAPKLKWDRNTIITGQVLIKSDSGLEQIDKINGEPSFAMTCTLKVFILVLAFQILMDDNFQEFKIRTDAMAKTLFKSYVYEFAKAPWDCEDVWGTVQDCQDDQETEIKTAALTNDNILPIINGHPEDSIKK